MAKRKAPTGKRLKAKLQEQSPDQLTISRLKRRLKDSEAQRKASLTREGDLRDKIETLLEITSEPVKGLKITTSKANDYEGVPVFVAGDWHIGERIFQNRVDGLNIFNAKEAQERVENFGKATRWMLDMFQRRYQVDTAILIFLGDMISGNIHEELRETNTLTATEATLKARDLMVGVIDNLLKEEGLKKLVIPCVYGNHGRTKIRPSFKTSAQDSYEWMLYHMVARHYAGNDRVEFHIPESRMVYVDVMGFTLRITHGDTIRYRGGIGSIHVPLYKKLEKWDRGQRADFTVYGHYHTWTPGPTYLGNGALLGMSEYSRDNAFGTWEPPTQGAFFVEKGRGIRYVTPIFVSNKFTWPWHKKRR